MAEDTFGLFNTQTPGAMRQAYMAQMQPSLKDLMMAPDYGGRLIGLMGGAGGGLGVSAGSLLGGRTAAEAEMSLMDEAKKEAAQVGTDEESRLAAFVSALRKRGLEGYAMQATKELDRVMKSKAELARIGAETGAKQAAAAKDWASVVTEGTKAASMKDRIDFLISEESMSPTKASALASNESAFANYMTGKKKVISDDFASAAGELGYTGKATYDQFSPEEFKKVNNLVEARKAREAARSPTAQLTAAIAADRAENIRLQNKLLEIKTLEEQGKLDRAKAAQASTIANGISQAQNNIRVAEQALNLAPNTLLGGVSQATFQAIPWTDAKALNNLVTTLKSNEALGKLAELKAQTATGASGLGSVTEKELDLLIANITQLDPTDKNFKNQLKVVFDRWARLEKNMKADFKASTGREWDTPSVATTPKAVQPVTRKTKSGVTYTVEE